MRWHILCVDLHRVKDVDLDRVKRQTLWWPSGGLWERVAMRMAHAQDARGCRLRWASGRWGYLDAWGGWWERVAHGVTRGKGGAIVTRGSEWVTHHPSGGRCYLPAWVTEGDES